MRRSLIAALLCGFALTATAAAAPVFAADEPAKADAAKDAKADKDEAKAPVAETAVVNHRSIPFRGGTLAYTVTPGTLTIRNDDGEPIASVFYVAYTMDRSKDGGPRPVTFLPRRRGRAPRPCGCTWARSGP